MKKKRYTEGKKRSNRSEKDRRSSFARRASSLSDMGVGDEEVRGSSVLSDRTAKLAKTLQAFQSACASHGQWVVRLTLGMREKCT